MSEPTSLSTVTILVTIPSIKESATAQRVLARQYQEGIQVPLRVIGIFLVARLTTRYIESIIYIVSLNVIREATTTTTRFNGVKVYQVILRCQYQGIVVRWYRLIAASGTQLSGIQLSVVGVVLQVVSEYIYLLTLAFIVSIADLTAKGKGQVLYLRGDILLK